MMQVVVRQQQDTLPSACIVNIATRWLGHGDTMVKRACKPLLGPFGVGSEMQLGSMLPCEGCVASS